MKQEVAESAPATEHSQGMREDMRGYVRLVGRRPPPVKDGRPPVVQLCAFSYSVDLFG